MKVVLACGLGFSIRNPRARARSKHFGLGSLGLVGSLLGPGFGWLGF